MSRIKGKFIEDATIAEVKLDIYNTPTDGDELDWSAAQGKMIWAARPTLTDGKDAKVSAGDTTPGFLAAKVLGTANKIVVTKTNAGSNESLVVSPGADLFDKVAHTTDAITEGTTKLFYTDTRADARITAQKGANSGLATLDTGGKVPSSQLPAYVDDVLEYANLAAFPGSGSTGLIYIAIDTNKTYRWSGSVYVEISASLALGETSSTACAGDKGKTAYDHSQAAHAPSTAQKNSDITKAEIEAKLTGAISSHSHAATGTKKVEIITLAAGDITAKYIDLASTPLDPAAVQVTPSGGIQQLYGVDFSVITNGSVIKRVSWSALAMDTQIDATDKLIISYTF